MLVLWGAVGLVMLLACVNVASLMISRTLARQRARWPCAQQSARVAGNSFASFSLKACLVGLAGGALGLLIAVWGTRAIGSLVPKGFTTSVYDLDNIHLDWRVFAFTLSSVLPESFSD